MLKNSEVKPGDVLILTKALGTGILNTAMKADLISKEAAKAVTESMATLNKAAAEIMVKYPVHSVTDVTGFGLAGHSYEMAKGSGVTITIDSSSLPILPQAYEMAQMGIIPSGAYGNREWISCGAAEETGVDLALTDVLYDPQTSGGLLIAIPEKDGQKLLRELRESIPVASVVGYAEERHGKPIIIK